MLADLSVTDPRCSVRARHSPIMEYLGSERPPRTDRSQRFVLRESQEQLVYSRQQSLLTGERPRNIFRLTISHSGIRRQGISTRRVIWPLFSQKVLRLARKGSLGAGWMFPSTSIARDVTRCSPDAGVPQSNVQNLQAKPWFLPNSGPSRFAALQGPASIWTCTDSIGVPQAAPMIV